MEIYVALSPDTGGLPATNNIPVWAACCTAERLRIRNDIPLGGFLMILWNAPMSDVDLMCHDILRKCLSGQHNGIILDFPPGQSELVRLVQRLSELCPQYGISLCVPEAYAKYCHDLIVVSTTLVGGNLLEKLKRAVSQYGADHIMIDLERTCRDYLLPYPVGPGRCLSCDTFQKLAAGCTRYYSPELCARYFTYRSSTQSHYVVYDDAETLRKKLDLAEELGIHKSLVIYPETRDLWPL